MHKSQYTEYHYYNIFRIIPDFPSFTLLAKLLKLQDTLCRYGKLQLQNVCNIQRLDGNTENKCIVMTTKLER